MKTVVAGQVQGDVGVKKQKKSLVWLVFGWFAWVYDRFDFWVVHRGRRLRPEVGERLERAVRDTEQGRNLSPGFTNAEDMIKWLDDQNPQI